MKSTTYQWLGKQVKRPEKYEKGRFDGHRIKETLPDECDNR
ncbi:MAG: hypothetical protein RIB30_07885 [Thalassospira sp.]